MDSNNPGSYRRALRSPLVMATILTGILIAAVGASLVSLLLGGLAIAGAFLAAGAVQRSSAFQKAVRDEVKRNERVESERNLTFRIEELDSDARTRMKAILKCHRDIIEMSRSTDRDTLPEVANVLLQIDVMLSRGLSISQKRRELLANLRNIDAQATKAKLTELERSLTAEQDTTRKTQIQTEIGARTNELKDASATEATCSKILTELDGIESSLAVVRSNLMKLDGEDAESRIAAGKELSRMLGSVAGDTDVPAEAESDGSVISD